MLYFFHHSADLQKKNKIRITYKKCSFVFFDLELNYNLQTSLIASIFIDMYVLPQKKKKKKLHPLLSPIKEKYSGFSFKNIYIG